MASETSIVNRALIELGAGTITNLTDQSNNANTMGEIYADVRDALLRSHTWNFATNRAKLGRLSSAPEFGFTYRYQLPSDFIRVSQVFDNNQDQGRLKYRIEDDRTIHTDAEEVYLRYVRRVTDPNAMTADFREALSFALATAAAIKITNSRSVRDDMRQEFRRARSTARSSDSIEDHPEDIPEGSWVEDRGL